MKIISTLFPVLFLAPLLCLAGETDIPRLINDSGPTHGVQPLVLNELWRAGGEDEDVIFGRIVDVIMDKDRNIYVLDNQLCQVVVFSKDGEHLRDLSRQGDGPGELRQPMGLAFLADDVLGIGMGFPGKMVALQLDGTPLKTYYPIGEPADGNVGIMLGVQSVNGVLVASGGRINIGDPEHARSDRFLSVTDPQCTNMHHILEGTTPLDLTGQRYVEATDYYPDFRWALDRQGRIYAATERDSYELSVFDSSGKLLLVFGRTYKPRKRTQDDKDEVSPLINLNGDTSRTEMVIEDHDECIRRVLFNHDEETIWVQTPHGSEEQPDDILESWDVFSTGGEFLRQVPIPLGHEMNEGASYLVGGGKLVVIKGTASVFSGDEDSEDSLEDVEPLEVICYEIQ